MMEPTAKMVMGGNLVNFVVIIWSHLGHFVQILARNCMPNIFHIDNGPHN